MASNGLVYQLLGLPNLATQSPKYEDVTSAWKSHTKKMSHHRQVGFSFYVFQISQTNHFNLNVTKEEAHLLDQIKHLYMDNKIINHGLKAAITDNAYSLFLFFAAYFLSNSL